MKRIFAMVLAGGLSALTLGAAPAHADEGAYDRRDGAQQQYHRQDRAPQRDGRHERDDRHSRSEDAYRRADDGWYDGYRKPEQRDRPGRQASVGIETGDVGVRIDIGHWFAHG